MEVLGIDIGFGFTKATDGKETLVFKSLFGDATDLQFWVDFGEASLSNYFNVTIDGKSYFIGDLAEQQSNVISFTLDQEKLISEFVKVLSLTVAGVFLNDESSINVRNGTFLNANLLPNCFRMFLTSFFRIPNVFFLTSSVPYKLTNIFAY